MKFPTIGEIATCQIISVNIDDKLSYAIDRMMQSEHRSIVVVREDGFSILNVFDVINFQNNQYDLDTPLSALNLSKVTVLQKETNVLEALEQIESAEFICVVDEENSLYGLVTHSDITANIDPDILMESYKLEDFFKIGKKVKTVSQDSITSDVLKDMVQLVYDNIIIVDEKIRPIGILTSKNIINLVKRHKDLSLPIQHYMVSPVESVKQSATIKEALTYIKTKHYKRAVIVNDEGVFIGVISQSELISLTYSNWVALMHQHEEELSELNTILKKETKKYERLASTDTLTCLYNRYKFSELFLFEHQVMLQRNNKMALLMLDIDFFKHVNDTYGHDVGDKVLVAISSSILQTLRNIDIVGRWGGEEFVMLLPTANLTIATQIANNIRTTIEKKKIDVTEGVTVSLGVTQIQKDDTLQRALKRADNALYIAKESGRNCVKVADKQDKKED